MNLQITEIESDAVDIDIIQAQVGALQEMEASQCQSIVAYLVY